MRFQPLALLALSSQALARQHPRRQDVGQHARRQVVSSTSSIITASTTAAVNNAVDSSTVASTTAAAPVGSATTGTIADPVNTINGIFSTLATDVTPPLKTIQSIVNANPNVTADELKANTQYTQAIADIGSAFTKAATAAQKLIGSGTAARRLLARQASSGLSSDQLNQLTSGALQAIVGLLNGAETTLSNVPVAGQIAQDVFGAINEPISQLFGVLNSLLGTVTGLASSLLGGLLGASSSGQQGSGPLADILGADGLLGGLLGPNGLVGGLLGSNGLVGGLLGGL